MKTLLRIVACGLLLAVAVSRATATDVPLNGPAAESFGPGTLDVVVGGVGLGVQPATFSVDVPGDTTVVAAYLYINGRGAGDADVVVNGVPMAAPLVAQSSELPFGDCSHIETRRIDLVGAFALVPGTNTLTVDGYTACQPGGAFVVAVVNDPNAPTRTVDILEGADYAHSDFDPPFGPDTEVGGFDFAPITGVRTGRFFIFTHDTQPDRADALWTLAASSSTTPTPASLVGGSGGATLFELDRLGVPTSAGGFSVGERLDIVPGTVSVPTGADYFAFQVESPGGVSADGVGLSVAVLALPTEADDDGGDGGGPGPGGGGAYCGNGAVEGAETCDDGNRVGGDGCSESCLVETQSRTLDFIVRVRKHRRERVWYYTQLPRLSSDAVGTTPVHVTIAANGLALLDLELPAKAWQRVEPRATTALPTGKFAAATGIFGATKLRYLRLWPLVGTPAYNLKFKLRHEMLKRPAGITQLTTIIRVGDQTFSSTDQMIIRRKGKILRNVAK
jgi:cysteine-rich repeat protein